MGATAKFFGVEVVGVADGIDADLVRIFFFEESGGTRLEGLVTIFDGFGDGEIFLDDGVDFGFNLVELALR